SFKIFQSYCWLFDQSIWPNLDYVEFIPTYQQWKRFAQLSSSQSELLIQLAQYFDANQLHDPAVATWRWLSQRLPDTETINQLNLAYKRRQEQQPRLPIGNMSRDGKEEDKRERSGKKKSVAWIGPDASYEITDRIM